MPLVYLPDPTAFFLWGDPTATRALPSLAGGGAATRAELVTPNGRHAVKGLQLPLFETMAKLAVAPAASVDALSGSVATWVAASKLALELVSRERVVPAITRRGGRIEARWAVAPEPEAGSTPQPTPSQPARGAKRPRSASSAMPTAAKPPRTSAVPATATTRQRSPWRDPKFESKTRGAGRRGED